MNIHKYKHLSLDQRISIQSGIDIRLTKSAIASSIKKDKSTVAKEIARHRLLKAKCPLPLECANYKLCKFGRHCHLDCLSFVPFKCRYRDISPGACNSCPTYSKCRFNKFIYNADLAHKTYLANLSDSRSGIDLLTSEAFQLGNLIKPLIAQGQSPYQIITNHPELGICEKTLYNYIELGIFSCVGIYNIDLRRKTSRKLPRSKKVEFKKRKDRKFLKNRLYLDFKSLRLQEPLLSVVEMDTVYNDSTHGPFIQTFKFKDYGFLFALYHEKKDSASMVQGVNQLEGIIGSALFNETVPILLTDRGTEFSDAIGLETSIDGQQRTRVFYCDPMQSGQKGSLENIHIELRYILPKQSDLKGLGLNNQESLNKILSHINSTPKGKLKGKSSIEMMEFLNPELLECFLSYGLEKIEKDKVVLKPYLLKNK